jgi:hypothetical protein
VIDAIGVPVTVVVIGMGRGFACEHHASDECGCYHEEKNLPAVAPYHGQKDSGQQEDDCY